LGAFCSFDHIVPETLALSSRKDTSGKHSMVYSNLWQGRTGRLPYLVAFVISSAAIAVLPFVAGKITIASAGGMDPQSGSIGSDFTTIAPPKQTAAALRQFDAASDRFGSRLCEKSRVGEIQGTSFFQIAFPDA
jgi:hypothetical protein